MRDVAPSAELPPYRLAPVASLVPYARNARTHSDAQVAQIAASIREFGFTNPILIDGERGVIAGHGRLLAARKLGMADVPTLELSHLTPAQRRAYMIADNRLALSPAGTRTSSASNSASCGPTASTSPSPGSTSTRSPDCSRSLRRA